MSMIYLKAECHKQLNVVQRYTQNYIFLTAYDSSYNSSFTLIIEVCPALVGDNNPYLSLLREVTSRTARLVSMWQVKHTTLVATSIAIKL